MTPLARGVPERAPVVSSSAVGSPAPIPRRPPDAFISSGSRRQTTLRDPQPAGRAPIARTYARRSGPRRACGSTRRSVTRRRSGDGGHPTAARTPRRTRARAARRSRLRTGRAPRPGRRRRGRGSCPYRLVLVVQAQPARAGAALVATERRPVEPGVHAPDSVHPPPERGVGVEDLAVDERERAHARQLADPRRLVER